MRLSYCQSEKWHWFFSLQQNHDHLICSHWSLRQKLLRTEAKTFTADLKTRMRTGRRRPKSTENGVNKAHPSWWDESFSPLREQGEVSYTPKIRLFFIVPYTVVWALLTFGHSLVFGTLSPALVHTGRRAAWTLCDETCVLWDWIIETGLNTKKPSRLLHGH